MAKKETGESMHVVVELKEMPAPPGSDSGSRAEQMQIAKKSFAARILPLKEKIANLGGEVLEEAWINSTISARVPKSGIDALRGDALVQSVDAPRAIERESLKHE